jgi:hypothetical protein
MLAWSLNWLLALQGVSRDTLQAGVINAAISAAIGGVLALAAFRSRLDRHTDALRAVKEQRAEDREADRRQRLEDREADREAREAVANTFREMCQTLDRSRQQELQFIQRQVEQFRVELKQSERRQLHMLDLQSAIARKLDIRHRLTDAMTLPDDDEPTHRG